MPNWKQLVVLWIGVLIVVAMVLFPPWCMDNRPAGYRPIWLRVKPSRNALPLAVDATRLSFQIVATGIVVSAAMFTLRSKKE